MTGVPTCPEHGFPTALDTFSGEGGVTVGLQRAGFCVTAVDNSAARLRRNPAQHRVLVEDAVPYIRQWGEHFAFLWASPPCQDYSAGTRAMRAQGRATGHARLIPATREALESTGRPWMIENVAGARGEMNDPLQLCGTEFGLTAIDEDGTPLEMWRHRLVEASFPIEDRGGCRHGAYAAQVAGSYGGARRDKVEARTIRHGGYVPSATVQRQLLGIDWMTQQGMYLSIPPAYAEHLGRQALAELSYGSRTVTAA